MASNLKKSLASNDKTNLTPMIDIVFLLLAFFIMTTTIRKEEGSLGLQLPGQSQPQQKKEKHNTITINIFEDGSVTMNGAPVDHYESRDMPMLYGSLRDIKSANDQVKDKTIVTIIAGDASKHQRSIDVLNACAKAGILMVSFDGI